MARMPYIAYLPEKGNLKELAEEVGSTEMAQGFINAVEEMKKNKDKPAYKKLNEIHDKAVKIGEDEIES